MNFFDQNLRSLISSHPSLLSHLMEIDGNHRFEIFQDPNDPLNVNIHDTLTSYTIYNGIPRDEILKQVDDFEKIFSRYPVIFIYGIANGLFVKLLLQNSNHKKIYVIEPELELLYIGFNLLDFSEEISKGSVHFLQSKEINFFTSIDIFGHPDNKVFCKTYHLEMNTPYYENFYGEDLLRCNSDFARAIHHIVTGLGNDTTDALIGLEWHLTNVSKMVETPTLIHLIEKAKTTNTAIIVSTGPSLSKQLPLLQKIKEHVTILSVDASLPILEKHNIKPDIVFSIERVAETAEFYNRTSKNFQEGIIFAISSLAHPLLIESAKNGVLQLSMRPFGYTRYFEQPLYGYLGIGMSAANMAYELAFHAKFKTIILIGQDLAYGTNGQSHSDGHIMASLGKNRSDFEVDAYGGQGKILTNEVWNMFRNFFENDIQIASQDGVTTINATEGGARIHGTLELSFEDTIAQYVDHTNNKTRIILTPPEPLIVEKNKAAVARKLQSMEKYVEAMQKKVSQLFEKVSACVETLDEIKADENLHKVDYDNLANLMQEIDEIKEKFDNEEFIDIFIDATQAMIIHHELDIARIQVRPIESDDDRRHKMIDWIYAHQHWLFALAGIMEAELIAIRRRGSQSQYVHKAELSEDGTSISGHFYDYQNEHTLFEISCLIDGEIIYTEQIDTNIRPKGTFWIPLPSLYFNNHIHTIHLKEKNTGIILAGTPVNRLLLTEHKNNADLFFVEPNSFEHLYMNKTIGFLAIEENLEDQEFISIIKRIAKTYTYTIKAFYFYPKTEKLVQTIFEKSEFNNIQTQQIQTINDIASSVTVYLHNMSSKVPNLTPIFEKYSNEVYSIVFNSSMHHSIKSFNDRYRSTRHPLLSNPTYFGISEEEVIQHDEKFFHILEAKYHHSVPNDFDNMFYIDFLIDYKLKYLLEDDNYRHSYINYVKRYNMKYGI